MLCVQRVHRRHRLVAGTEMTRPMPVYEIGQRNRLLQTVAVIGLGQARPTARAGISDIHRVDSTFQKLPSVHL